MKIYVFWTLNKYIPRFIYGNVVSDNCNLGQKFQNFSTIGTPRSKSKEFKQGTTRKMSKGQHMWNIKDSKFYLFVSRSKKDPSTECHIL